MSGKSYDYNNASAFETERLSIQAEVLEDFESPVYREVLSGYPSPVIIDIGCNNGVCAMARLKENGYSFYLGADRSRPAVESAQKRFADAATAFICADVTEADFVEQLKGSLPDTAMGLADIVIVSMLLLHLAEPLALLKSLRELLRDGGTLLVKDIDDRDNCSSSDPEGIFAHAYTIAFRNDGSGNRHTGREIGQWLEQAGYSGVTLRRRGLSTNGMDPAHREALYTTYFGFFEEDCQLQMRTDPAAEQDLLWCREKLPVIKKCILREDFWFSLGFCIYKAQK